jgi:mannose-6-phosphate isomerase-like protein (cupin superfamily)
MSSFVPLQPTNLTGAAEKLPWSEVPRLVNVSTSIGDTSLEARAVDTRDERDPLVRDFDKVYVVISGYGEFCYGDHKIEFTAGDVLFAPRGIEHRFVGSDSEIRLWRISLGFRREPSHRRAEQSRQQARRQGSIPVMADPV